MAASVPAGLACQLVIKVTAFSVCDAVATILHNYYIVIFPTVNRILLILSNEYYMRYWKVENRYYADIM